jgi:hypothetical protein
MIFFQLTFGRKDDDVIKSRDDEKMCR